MISYALARFGALPHWLAPFVVLTNVATPDGRLNGRRVLGAGTEAFGPIRRARL